MRFNPFQFGRFAIFLSSICLFTPAICFAQGDPRGVIVEEIHNCAPSFLVRVSVDHPSHIYKGGEVMKAQVVSEQAGYLYLFYCDANKQLSCLFPNKTQTDNHIPAGKIIDVPAATSNFRLRVGEPYGREVLKAVVTRQPLKELELKSLTQSDATPIDVSKAVRAVRVEYADRPADWAEHDIQITTISPNQLPERTHRRVGLFIGISEYAHVNHLTICHRDAQQMAQVMREHGRLDDLTILVNEQATLSAIRQAIHQMTRTTRPGDEVFIFWSGHGGRCADNTGSKPNGYDEFLVPYDAQTQNLAAIRSTMLLSDEIGRLVQEFDGRKAIVILDTCFSGGQSSSAKGLEGSPLPKGNQGFDLLGQAFQRMKDIGQKESALLASSTASQISFERREGDLSAMTYFLVKEINEHPQLTLPEASAYVKREVPAYIAHEFSGGSQTPVFFDNTTPPVYLRP